MTMIKKRPLSRYSAKAGFNRFLPLRAAMRLRPWWFVLVAGAASVSVMAGPDERTVCESGNIRHDIEINYPQGWSLPCEVYLKTPGERRRLWRADRSEGFCQEKAQILIDRRINSGWDCREDVIIDSPALTESSLISDLPPPR